MKIYLYGAIAWRHPLGLGQAIDWAREFGWDGIDARGLSLDIPGDLDQRLTAFGYDMLSPRHIRPSARADLRRRLEDTGVSLLAIYCASPVNLPWELGVECREHFAEYLQLAADLGAAWVRTINNTTFSGIARPMPAEEAYQRMVNGLRALSGLAQDLGVGILLENNENTVTSNAAALLRMRIDLGNACKVGITYDPVNAYLAGADVVKGMDMLRGKIDVLHVKNVKRAADGWAGAAGYLEHEWASLAEGDLDWNSLLRQARRCAFDGPVVFEYVNPFKGVPASYWSRLREPAEAARVEAEYLRSVLEKQA